MIIHDPTTPWFSRKHDFYKIISDGLFDNFKVPEVQQRICILLQVPAETKFCQVMIVQDMDQLLMIPPKIFMVWSKKKCQIKADILEETG